MLQQHHAEAIRFLAGGAGGAPESKRARMLARLDEPGEQISSQQFEGAAIAKEAGLVDGHGFGDGVLKGHISSGFETAHEFVEVGDAMVAQEPGEAGVEEIIARWVEHILGESPDQLTEVGVVDASMKFPCVSSRIPEAGAPRCGCDWQAEGSRIQCREGGAPSGRGLPGRRRRACPRRCCWLRPGR